MLKVLQVLEVFQVGWKLLGWVHLLAPSQLQSGQNNCSCCLEIKRRGIEVSHSGGSSDPSDLLMSHR